MKKTAVSILFAVTLAACLAFTTAGDRLFEIARNLEIFSTLFREVNESYVDEINPNTLITTSMNGMLDGLDPYTNYFGEDQVEDLRTKSTGQYGGIGAVTKRFGKRTVITEVYEGNAAARAGLRPGDEILRIDGISLNRLTMDEANQLVRGQVGNPLKVAVRRPDGTTTELEIKREKVVIKTVPYSGMIDASTGYLALREFTMQSGNEVKEAVKALHDKGAKQLIIDLRGNPGGLLEEAVELCGLFIPKNSLVVNTRGKTSDSNKEYRTRNAPVEPDIPVAVLINRSSASASEIVAGTLQDYDRAVIVGERSFGKGLVQVRRTLSYNSVAMITIAKYYTPSGRCIQALDYSRRRPDGSVGEMPDSLKKEFKTTGGRKVRDGGGIEPDIQVERRNEDGLTAQLDDSDLLFDFATAFTQKNRTIPPPRDFAISDKLLEEFNSWIVTQKPAYADPLGKSLEELKTSAAETGFDRIAEAQLRELTASLSRFRTKEIALRNTEIRMLLAREISSRYYFEKGAVESTFRYDMELKSATDVLSDQARYRKILGN